MSELTLAENTVSSHKIRSAVCFQEENPLFTTHHRPPVALLGTVLEKLLAGLLLQPARALGRHVILQLRQVLVGLKAHSTDSGQKKWWRHRLAACSLLLEKTQSAANLLVEVSVHHFLSSLLSLLVWSDLVLGLDTQQIIWG